MRLVLCTKVVAPVLALAACQQAPAAGEAGPVPEPPPVSSAVGMIPQSITGEYRVAGIDGAPLDGPSGMAVSIGEQSLSFEPRCLGSVWTYRLDNGTVTLTRDPRYGAQKGAGGAVVTCLPAVTPEYGRLAAAFDAVRLVRRTEGNALQFTGGGHEVLLFSQ